MFFIVFIHIFPMDKPLELTVGVCAYNEEKNIGELLRQVLDQRMDGVVVREVLVVSSGSTDRTDEIAGEIAALDARVRLLPEPERRGKGFAVNVVLREAAGDIIVLAGADLRLENDTLQKLVKRFMDEKVGMAGARPVPTNDAGTFPGFCSHLLWELHHRISLVSPKCGELIALRNLRYSIPSDMPVDEAYLEYRCRKDGLKIAYADDSIVRNRGPESVGDYIMQRRRIHAQHAYLSRKTGFVVSTANLGLVMSSLASSLKPDAKSLCFTAGAVSLEALCGLLGSYDLYLRGNIYIKWESVESTKEIKC